MISDSLVLPGRKISNLRSSMESEDKCSVFNCSATDDFVSLLTQSRVYTVRTNVFSEIEFKSFFKTVTGKANVKFHQCNSKPVKKYTYTETFVCHHSGIRSKKKDLG